MRFMIGGVVFVSVLDGFISYVAQLRVDFVVLVEINMHSDSCVFYGYYNDGVFHNVSFSSIRRHYIWQMLSLIYRMQVK